MMKHKLTVYRVVFVIALFQMAQYLPAQDVNDTVFYNLKQLLSLAAENNKDLQLVRLELQKSNQQIALKKSNVFAKS